MKKHKSASPKKAKKEKPAKIDGLNSDDLKKLHRAVRQVWAWSYPVTLVRRRSMGKDGFPRCENPKCERKGKPVPKVFVDHKLPVGEVGGPMYVQRMFIPSKSLQALCKVCHDAKTKVERKAEKEREIRIANANYKIDDFI